ncbi:MAG: MATE family efflux transporter [Bdellovibrionota bacterium]
MKSPMLSRKEKWKNILRLAWPLIIANSFWNLQLTIDRIFLSNHSTESLGAAMAVMGVFWVPMALLQQTAGYVTTFVAQYFGSQEKHMIGPSVWQSIYLSLGGGILFLGLIFCSRKLFFMMNHSPNITELEILYFNSLAYSALPTALVAVASGFFTGLGNTKTVMAINAVGLVVNALLDYAMISGHWGFPAMGIQGAGYATALAGFASALFGLALVFTRKHDRAYQLFSGWIPNRNLLKRFLRFGIPSGLQWALEGMAFTVFLILIGRFESGDAALASSSIAVTVMMLAVLPALGVAQAVMVLVGQHLGEKTRTARTSSME